MTAKKPQETAPPVEAPIVENNDCFIIMPIADHKDYKDGHFKRVYEDILAPACRGAGYRPVRADDVAQTNLIHLDILQKLLESPMAICDLSTRNPNVLFELGLRQAFDKPTVLVQEVGTPQIFDINLFRYTEYRNGLDYRDVLTDQKSIQKVLEETKIAVQENKSVNSIIKLLSITNPASLQDPSNFGEKEYFNVLMSEINSIKTIIAPSPKNNSSITNEKYIGYEDFVHLDLSNVCLPSDIKVFLLTLKNLQYIKELTVSTDDRSLMFKVGNPNIKGSDIISLVNMHNLTIKDISIDPLPF